MTFSIDIQHNSKECHYAECRDYLNVMLNLVMLSVVRLNVIMLNVVMPNAVMLSVVRLNVIMLSAVAHFLVECHQWCFLINIRLGWNLLA